MSDSDSAQSREVVEERFAEIDENTVIDVKLKLVWLKQDTHQKTGNWLNWIQSRDYAKEMNQSHFAGYNDWRFPEKEELLILVDPDNTIQDKYGKDMKMNPIFPNGPLATTWTADGVGSDGYIVNFTTGKADVLYKSKSGRMAVRAVRGTKMSERPSQR